MKNKLTATLCLALACVLLFMMTGCGSGANWCACFDTSEEIWKTFDKEGWRWRGGKDITGAEAWKYMELPNDERFVDTDYFIFSNDWWHSFDYPRNALIAYRIKVNDEYISIIAVTPCNDLNGNRFGCSFNEHVHLEVCDAGYISIAVKDNLRYFTTNPSTVGNVAYWKNHKPVGMIADLVSFESEEAAAEYFRSLKSVRVCDWKGNAQSGIDWFFVDERDVPQSEKDALALELAGVLFDHYVEAGFIQLYDK